jgi:hypothetical protein
MSKTPRPFSLFANTPSRYRFHVVVINERTGSKTRMTASPVTHEEGRILLKKITPYTWRRVELEPVR